MIVLFMKITRQGLGRKRETHNPTVLSFGDRGNILDKDDMTSSMFSTVLHLLMYSVTVVFCANS